MLIVFAMCEGLLCARFFNTPSQRYFLINNLWGNWTPLWFVDEETGLGEGVTFSLLQTLKITTSSPKLSLNQTNKNQQRSLTHFNSLSCHVLNMKYQVCNSTSSFWKFSFWALESQHFPFTEELCGQLSETSSWIWEEWVEKVYPWPQGLTLSDTVYTLPPYWEHDWWRLWPSWAMLTFSVLLVVFVRVASWEFRRDRFPDYP